MKNPDLLLDTHALLWYDSLPKKLSARALDAIKGGNSSVYCSAITFYELWQKAAKGSSEITHAHVESALQNLPHYGFNVLPVHAHHSQLAARLEWRNKDPFDRIIAAQAIQEKLHIVTADKAFDTLPDVTIVWE